MLNKIPILRSLKNDHWVKPFLKRYKKTLILAIFLGILTFVCGAGLMFCAGYLISKAATMPENILLIYVPIVLTRAFGIARPAVRYVERLVSHNWVLKMTSSFRKKLYDSLEVDAVFFNSKYQLGDILGLLADDVSHIQNLYLRSIFPMFVAWGLYALIVVGLGILSPLMGLWMLILFGLMIFAIPYWSVIINGARQAYEKEVQDLFFELTNDRFKIDYDAPIGEVDFGNGKGLLSSGYQAIIRILLELLYYQDMEIKVNALQNAWVVIDELDEYLSPRYSAAILRFLKKTFPWARWIVTTHSCDLVASTNDSNLIILDNGSYEVADSNDYTSISEVQIIFDRIFGNHEVFGLEVENILRRLLNNKINGAWGEKDEECLEQIESRKLTASQQIIVHQIREW